MYKSAIVTVTFLLLFSASVARAKSLGYYLTITPPNGGPMFIVGPYGSYHYAADTLGSALYSHPFACHLNPTRFNCRITGNGFAIPKDFPFPVPADRQILGLTPIQLPRGNYTLRSGWYFLFYTATGGSIETCKSLKYFEELARQVPGDEIPNYKNMNCPGAPCFSVGFDTACN